jgi:hypothetical protein
MRQRQFLKQKRHPLLPRGLGHGYQEVSHWENLQFQAVPKEQPPRKLSGKRTSGEVTELWRTMLSHDGHLPKG